MGFGVWDLGVGVEVEVWGLGFGVWNFGLGVRVGGLGVGVQDSGGFWAVPFRARDLCKRAFLKYVGMGALRGKTSPVGPYSSPMPRDLWCS